MEFLEGTSDKVMEIVEQVNEAIMDDEFEEQLINALEGAETPEKGIAALVAMLGSSLEDQLDDEEDGLIYGPTGVLIHIATEIISQAADAGYPLNEESAREIMIQMMEMREQMDAPEPMEEMPEDEMMMEDGMEDEGG